MSDSSIGRTLRAFVLGVLLGGLAGFAAGLLAAPEEGRKIRRRAAYQLDRIGSRVADFVDDALKPDRKETPRKDGDALVADAEIQAKQIREDIDALIGEMRQQKKTG